MLGWSSPTQPAPYARRLARVEERVRRALEARLHLERGEERLDRPSGHGEAALGDPCHAPPLLRQLLAARQVDARDLEQRDGLVPHVDVVARGRDEAAEQRRAENRVLGGERIGQPERLHVRVGRGQAQRVGLREARADEHVLDQSPQPLVAARGVPNIALRIGSVKGTSQAGSARPPRRGRSPG